MVDIPDLRTNIQQEAVQFRAAVSEAVGFDIGGSINFINNRQHSEKQFFINGRYNQILTIPSFGLDGFTFFQYDAEIIDTWMFIKDAGTSGTTELDIKRATTPGGSFTSIFSTTPKITSAAGNNFWIHLGTSFPNTTAPVLATTNVNAGDALRLDLLQVQGGSGVRSCGLVIHYRPR